MTPANRDGDADPLETLRARGERFLEEVSAEYHAAHAGHKQGAALQPIYEKHRAAYDDEALRITLDLFQSHAPTNGTVSATYRSARLLLDWLVESRAGQTGASWSRKRVADGNGATVCILPARDGYAAISPREDRQWAAWLEAMGSPAWGREARFATKKDRVAGLMPAIWR